MCPKHILVLTESGDSHSDVVIDTLHSAGECVVRLNTDRFFEDGVRIEYSQTTRSASAETNLWVNGEIIHARKTKSVWYRRPRTPIVDSVEDRGQQEFAERELNELLLNYFHLLKQSFWVSNISALDIARRKLPQLGLASDLGFSVPKTLVTNRPEGVRGFVKTCGGQIIYKTLHTPNLISNNELLGVQTSIVNESDLEHIDLISRSGGIFQEYLPKKFEVRVTVVGRKVFAAKIDSQKSEDGKVDWREALSLGQVPVEPMALPDHIELACLNMVEAYGLQFGAIDLIFSTNGQWYFLELNPNGQWYWVEYLTGLPMTGAMSTLLIRGNSV